MTNSPHLPKPQTSPPSTLEQLGDRPILPALFRSSRWWLWIVPALCLTGGAAYWAVNHLLVLPDLPGCRSAAQAQASSSVQLYCAQELANRKSIDDLRRAILTVNGIAPDDPFRAEGERWMRTWTEELLERGEVAFQNGDLKQAIRVAEQVPPLVRTRPLATERIDRWKLIWSKAERAYAQTEAEIGWGNWSRAIAAAKDLLTSGNEYWATTKYQELMENLQSAREVQEMQNKPVAQRTQRRSTDGVEDYLTQREQQREQEAAAQLAKAQQLASAGDVEGLRAAILEARQVLFGTPRYDEAQQAITTWREQINAIEDYPYLARARQIASKGDLESIEAAIREARRIGWGRPLYTEAHQQIEIWQEQAYQLRTTRQTQQLQTIEAVDAQTQTPQAQPAVAPAVETIEPVGSAGGEE
jgi:hypothetical protein